MKTRFQSLIIVLAIITFVLYLCIVLCSQTDKNSKPATAMPAASSTQFTSAPTPPALSAEQAIMPEEMLIKRAFDMKVGETAWTGQNSLGADRNGKLWLSNFSVESEKTDRCQMKILLTDKGYVVDLENVPDKDRSWQRAKLYYPANTVSVFRLVDGAKNIGGDGSQAVLPAVMAIPTVQSLSVGESCWVNEDWLFVGRENRIWLYRDATTSPTYNSSKEMLVTRTDKGYVVDVSQVRRRLWYKRPDVVKDDEYVPVVELKR